MARLRVNTRMFQILGAYSLFELFNRADVRVLLWLNHFLTAHPELQGPALFLSDRGSEILVLATLLALWFWPKNEQNRTLFGDADLRREQQTHGPLSRSLLANALKEDEYQPIITRTQSRAQVLLWGFGATVAFIFSRLLAAQLGVSRPFTSYWAGFLKAPQNMAAALENLQASGSFPSGHAAVVAALACALFYWNRRLGLIWIILAVALSLCRIEVGFHFPKDVLGGAAVGLLCVWPLLRSYRREGRLFHNVNDLARAFDQANAPYCYLLYFLLFLGCLEAATHFNHVLQILFAMRASFLHARGA